MPDILIRGMEMPKNCRMCPFRKETYLLTRQVCVVNNGEEISEGIDAVDKACPLIELSGFDAKPAELTFEEMISEAELCISTAALVLNDTEYKDFSDEVREML